MLLKVGVATAQQEALYSQYMFNQQIYNPAYTGIKGGMNINGFVRNQWMGLEGAPETQTLSVDRLMDDEKSAFGVHFVNDAIGAQKSTSLFANYAYWLPVNDKHRLSFGVAAGVSQDMLDGTKLRPTENDDIAIPLDLQKRIYPDVTAGIYLTNDKYYVGFSASKLISSLSKPQYNFSQTYRHYYFTAGYVATLNDDVKIYPSLLIKNDFKAPMQYDISTMILMREVLWMGLSYRNSMKQMQQGFIAGSSDNTLALIARLSILKNYKLGYAYDFNRSNIAASAGGTHEISFSVFLNAGQVRGVGPKCYF